MLGLLTTMVRSNTLGRKLATIFVVENDEISKFGSLALFNNCRHFHAVPQTRSSASICEWIRDWDEI